MGNPVSTKARVHLAIRAGAWLGLFAIAVAFASAEELKTLHTGVPQVASRLPRLEALPAARRLQLAIGLPLRDRDSLNNLLRQLYDSSSTNFHRYRTPDQFTEKFGPTEKDYEAVIQFAESNGLTVTRKFGNRAVVDVSGTVSDIQTAFHVSLGSYQHPTENRRFYAPDVEPAISTNLAILYIKGLDDYFIPRPSSFTVHLASERPKPNFDNGSGLDGSYAGADFRNAYVPGVSLDGSGQVVGLVEFDGYTPGDITKYATLAGLSTVPLKNVLVDGVSNTPGGANDEVAVDIEMVLSMAQGISHVNVYEGVYDASVMNEIVSPTLGETLPNQVSCSWGIGGNTNLQQQLMQMAAQGQSFFYASGDSGAPKGGTNASPQDDNYQTSVGGTALTMNGTGASWQSESAWGGSYGAVVTSLPIPIYQVGIDMSSNGGSTSHRNIPDVAMEADFVEVVFTLTFTNGDPPITGHVGTGAGTSAAAPLWAGFTALVNQQAASEGKGPVGFINPLLYDIARGGLYPSCFHDITTGNTTNAGNHTEFFAGPGYDLCTGWGSPNGPALINALVAYAGPVFVDFNYTGIIQSGSYFNPFKTLVQGTNAVSPGGTIFIKSAGSSSETMTISKRMTITASGGPATVGN
jgi:subtilase family serine protease